MVPGAGLIVTAAGLLQPLRGFIARDGMYADFAGAKICPRSKCNAFCEPHRFKS